MKPRNLYIYRGDLESLQEEYTWLGYDTQLKNGCLTVFALKRKKRGNRKEEKRGRK